MSNLAPVTQQGSINIYILGESSPVREKGGGGHEKCPCQIISWASVQVLYPAVVCGNALAGSEKYNRNSSQIGGRAAGIAAVETLLVIHHVSVVLRQRSFKGGNSLDAGPSVSHYGGWMTMSFIIECIEGEIG